jgi:hypothetical protein
MDGMIGDHGPHGPGGRRLQGGGGGDSDDPGGGEQACENLECWELPPMASFQPLEEQTVLLYPTPPLDCIDPAMINMDWGRHPSCGMTGFIAPYGSRHTTVVPADDGFIVLFGMHWGLPVDLSESAWYFNLKKGEWKPINQDWDYKKHGPMLNPGCAGVPGCAEVPMPEERSHAVAVRDGDDVYVFGGRQGTISLNDVWRLNLVADDGWEWWCDQTVVVESDCGGSDIAKREARCIISTCWADDAFVRGAGRFWQMHREDALI